MKLKEDEGGREMIQIRHYVHFKTDSAQNKCKNYLLNIYSQHMDFLNTI